MSNDTELKPPCDCCELSAGGYWRQSCYCGDHGELAEAAVWCDQQNTRPTPSDSVMVNRDDLQELMVGSAQYKDATEATRDRVKALLAQEKTNDGQ